MYCKFIVNVLVKRHRADSYADRKGGGKGGGGVAGEGREDAVASEGNNDLAAVFAKVCAAPTISRAYRSHARTHTHKHTRARTHTLMSEQYTNTQTHRHTHTHTLMSGHFMLFLCV